MSGSPLRVRALPDGAGRRWMLRPLVFLGSLGLHFAIVFGSPFARDYLKPAAAPQPAPAARRDATASGEAAPAPAARAPKLPKTFAFSASPGLPPGGDPSLDTAAPGTVFPFTELRQPGNGKFAVVVLGSAAAAAFPGADEILTGRVVYTVYLRVGAPKEWVLQFSLPGTVEESGKESLPLEAPYPLRMLRPELIFPDTVDYLLIHGRIDAAGRFERLEWVGDTPEDGAGALLLQALEGWQMRPAKRDGAPVAVEILLIIPAGAD